MFTSVLKIAAVALLPADGVIDPEERSQAVVAGFHLGVVNIGNPLITHFNPGVRRLAFRRFDLGAIHGLKLRLCTVYDAADQLRLIAHKGCKFIEQPRKSV